MNRHAAMALACLLLVGPAQGQQDEQAPPPRPLPRPLALQEVLQSVDRFYPLIRAVEQERQIARGRLTSAEGAFDLNLIGRSSYINGSFDSERHALGFEQALAPFGLTVFGGYRISGGKFPVYYGDRETGDGGEVSAGVAIPLLRGREIDSRRANLQKAQIDVQMADPNILVRRIDVARAAARAYWSWAAAGQQVRVADRVLKLAQQREKYLEEQVKAMKLPRIALTDNRRMIVDRQARLVAAQRVYQQAALILSLYLRNQDGSPRIPDPETIPTLPDAAAAPDEPQRQQDIRAALARRPELAQLELRRQRLEVDLRLAENQTLPGLGVIVRGAQDMGFGKKDLDRYTYEAGLALDVPLQRRDARGRIQAIQGELVQVQAQLQLQQDRVINELLDVYSDLERAYELVRQSRQAARLAVEMRQAEKEQFDAGKSNLIFLNLRELAEAEAEIQVVAALAQYQRALADYAAALGVDLSRPLP